MTEHPVNRRTFLAGSASATAALSALPAVARGPRQAAEFRSQGAPAGCARLADEAADSYEATAAAALAHVSAQTAGPAVTAADMDCAFLP